MNPDPALAPFFNVNDPLPDWLLPRLDTYLEHRDKQIQFFQDEADRLRREADRLDQQCRHLQHERSTYATLRSPLRRVPPEILAKVIHWALGGPGSFVDGKGRAEFLRLRQVARSWRRTAYSTPYLWCYLSVDVEHFHQHRDGPSVVGATLTRRLGWWFGHAGRDAEVHLDLGIRDYPWDERVNWTGYIWGSSTLPFRLVTVQLWGQLVLGPSVQEKYAPMQSIKNLTISEPITGIEDKFPVLESLKLSMLDVGQALDIPFRHPSLTSLFLSHLLLVQESFPSLFANLPALEELVVDSCLFSDNSAPPEAFSLTNTSLRRLVAPASTLFFWKAISFPSLQFCQIIPNVQSELMRKMANEYSKRLLVLVAGFLGKCNVANLTLDLTRARMSTADVLALLSPLPALRSLRLSQPSIILSDEAAEWRANPNVKHVVCEMYEDLPKTFHPIPWVQPPSTILSIHVVNPNASKPSSVVFRDGGFSRMVLVFVPEARMAEILDGEFPIRNHEYEALLKQTVP
jgi:F-box-like